MFDKLRLAWQAGLGIWTNDSGQAKILRATGQLQSIKTILGRIPLGIKLVHLLISTYYSLD